MTGFVVLAGILKLETQEDVRCLLHACESYSEGRKAQGKPTSRIDALIASVRAMLTDESRATEEERAKRYATPEAEARLLLVTREWGEARMALRAFRPRPGHGEDPEGFLPLSHRFTEAERALLAYFETTGSAESKPGA